MAVTFTQLIKSQQTVTSTLTISGVTPTNTADLIVIAFVTGTGTSSITGITGTNGLNGTWTQINISTGGTVLPETVDVWWSIATSTVAGTLTCSNALAAVVVSYMAYDVSGLNGYPIVQNAIGNGTTVTSSTATLGALATTFNIVMAFGSSGGGSETAGSGMTVLDNYTTSPTVMAMSSTAAGSPTSVVMNCASGNAALVAFELSVVPAGTPTGLVVWWKFDEGTGTLVTTDSSGNSNTGTLMNSPAWVSGIIGPFALTFNGTNQYVTNTNTSNRIISSSTLTLSAWLNPTASSSGGSVCGFRALTDSAGAFYMNNQGNQTIEIRIRTNTGVTTYDSGAILTYNSWQQIAATYDGTNLISYLNGTQVNSQAANLGPFAIGSLPFLAGFNEFNSSFTNYAYFPIDDVRLYNIALTAPQIAALYALGNKKGILNLKTGWWGDL